MGSPAKAARPQALPVQWRRKIVRERVAADTRHLHGILDNKGMSDAPLRWSVRLDILFHNVIE
jgi:hypothetical protein